MGRKIKYSKEFKIKVCKEYLAGKGSSYFLGEKYGFDGSYVRSWMVEYRALGEAAFEPKNGQNSQYTKEFKEKVVLEYLNGNYSYRELAIKYNISAHTIIIKWVKDYNSHIELKDHIPGDKDIYMTKCRKVTQEEKLEIVKYCLEHDLNYIQTCKIYDVTYPNIYNWVKKYKKYGEEGLSDKRGRHKSDEEVDEIILLKRQLKAKEHELEMALLENKLLKKLDEIERRRYAEQVNMKSNIRQSKKSGKKIKK